MRSINKRELFIQSWEIYRNNLSAVIGIILSLLAMYIMGGIFEGFFPGETIETIGIKIPLVTPQYIIYKIAFLLLSSGILLGICAQMIKLIRLHTVDGMASIFNYVDKSHIKVGAMLLLQCIFFMIGIIFFALFVGTEDMHINSIVQALVYDCLGIPGYDNLEMFISMVFSDNIKIIGLIVYIFIYAYISLKTSFYPYLIVDKNYGVVNSIRSSFTKTNGFEFELFIIYVLLVFINILGVWGLMTGSIIFLFYFALFSMPFSLIVHSLVYTTYLSDQNHVTQVGDELSEE